MKHHHRRDRELAAAHKMFASAGLKLHGHHSHGHQPPLSHDPPHRHTDGGWWPAGTGPFRPGPGSPSFGARMPETHRPGVMFSPAGHGLGPGGGYYRGVGDVGWEGRRVDKFGQPPSVGARVPYTHRPGATFTPAGAGYYRGVKYTGHMRHQDDFSSSPNIGCGIGSTQRWNAVTHLLSPAMMGASPAAAAAKNALVKLSAAQTSELKAAMLAAMAPPKGHVTFQDLVAAGKAGTQAQAQRALTMSAAAHRSHMQYLMMTPEQQAAYDASIAANKAATLAAARKTPWGGSAPSSSPPGTVTAYLPPDPSASVSVSIPDPSASASFSF